MRDLTTNELSTKINLTPQTIRKYGRKGMPYEFKNNSNYYNQKECQEWIARNIKGRVRNGKD